MLPFYCLLLGSAGLAYLLTALLRGYGQRRLLDHPNHRSSHQLPTPRGGGMAFVLTFLLLTPLLFYPPLQQVLGEGMGLPYWQQQLRASGLSFGSLFSLWLAGWAVALIGFIDDHHSLTPRTRLIVQGLAALMVVLPMGGVPPLTIFGFTLPLGIVGVAIAWLGVVWCINLYNFMDGIDGIAATEALSVCLVMAGCHYALSGQISGASLSLLLATAVFGFFCWNFPPAKIFMGDGGSGFLGLALATLMLLDTQQHSVLLFAWLVMLGVFVVDATFTLIRRYRLKCRLSEGHRTHAYQYATRRYRSHKAVTLAVLAINLLWLAPIALLITLGRVDGGLGLLIAYLPLLYLAHRFQAGVPE